VSKATLTLRHVLLATVSLCVTLAAATLWISTAHAALTHPYTGQSFGPEGLGASDFSRPSSVTVDQESGDVYVYDTGEEGRVYKFDAAGEPVDFSSLGTNVIAGVGSAGPSETEIAVDSSSGPDSGDIYIANNQAVRIYGANGLPLGELTGAEMCGVAVDPSGAVYVGVYPETVRKYVPVLNPVTAADEAGSLGGLHSVCNVAADSEGNVYAATYYGGVTRYDALQFGAETATGTTVDQFGSTLAVDPSTNDLLVNDGSDIGQYDSAGVLTETSGGEQLQGSSGVGVKGGKVYAPIGDRVGIFAVPVVVPDVSVEAPSRTATTAVLKGTVNPDGVAVSSCQFEYGDETPTNVIPCEQDPGSGGSPVSVTATIGGLAIDSYHVVRLRALNANGASVTQTLSYKTLGPAIFEHKAVNIGRGEATVATSVAPNGQSTVVSVEYGLTSAYGSTTAPVNVGSAAEASATAAIKLSGLAPGTAYHVRVVASNESASVHSEDFTFTTFENTALGLPDGRGYEKVSFTNADGNVYQDVASELSGEGNFTELPMVAAADGNAFAYVADPSESGGIGREGGGAGNEYLAVRNPAGGWSASNITPSPDAFQDIPVYQAFSKNLTVGFLSDKSKNGLAAGAPTGGYSVLYENEFASKTYRPLITAAPPNRGAGSFGSWGVLSYSPTNASEPTYAGSSADLSHLLFMANDALTSEALDGGEEENNLYDYHEGSLVSVNILPDGSPEPNASFGGPVLPVYGEGDAPALDHTISEDGRRIFWTGMSTHDLYMREDDERTVQIDASVGGGGLFWMASPDGSKVLFTKEGDLYEYDVAGAQTLRLTNGAEVQGVVGASENLSYVYFAANAALAPGAEHQECAFRGGGGCNVYALHLGESARLVGVLSDADSFSKPESFIPRAFGVWEQGLADKEAQVTPDGRHLVFGSQRPLTGYDSHKAEEIFLYDYDGSSLRCVSCNPTGEQPSRFYSAYMPVSHVATYLPHWMSEDGNRVFFDSLDPLVPADTNNNSDVYEWERDGAGTCAKPDGCIFLISGGVAIEGSTLADASASGDDVFFMTRSQLSEEDKNEMLDVYDARVNAARPPAAPQCTGSGCQGAPQAPPVFSTPSSSTYNGVGNFESPAKTTGKAKKTKAKKPRVKKKPKKSKKKRKANKKKAKKAGERATSVHKSAKSHRRGK
jgi:hypothetical protein